MYYCRLSYFWLLHIVQVILVALLFISGCICPTCLDKLLACEKTFPQCVQTLLGIALLSVGDTYCWVGPLCLWWFQQEYSLMLQFV